MTYRDLGSTGVKVSPLTLGTMMFGACGNPDHDESIAIIRRALDSGINVIDTADVYARASRRRSSGKAIKGRRDDIVLATKFHGAIERRRPQPAGQLTPLDHPRGREHAAPAADRLDRPLPGAPAASRRPTSTRPWAR